MIVLVFIFRYFQYKIKFLNISYEAMINYHLLWYTYNKLDDKRFTVYCLLTINDCMDPTQFFFPFTKNSQKILNSIRANPKLGVIIEANVTKAPCLDKELEMQMNISKICEIVRAVTPNKVRDENGVSMNGKVDQIKLEHRTINQM